MKRHHLILLAALLWPPAALAQVQPLEEVFEYDHEQPAAGHWIGDITTSEGRALFGAILITRSAGDEPAWSVSMTYLPAGAIHKACEALAIEGSSVAFDLLAGSAIVRFEGTISEDGQRYTGHVRVMVGGEERPEQDAFEFARTPRPMDLPRPRAYTGELTIPQLGNLGMTLVFAETPGGHWVGHCDVPAQALLGYPLVHIRREGDSITADLPVLPMPASIEGVFEEDGRRVTGSFKQAGMDLAIDFPLDASYVSPSLARPQEPKPPYPYQVREVSIEHPEGHTLAGTLTIPDTATHGPGPFPAAVLISGSGPQDRDETLMGHKPFLVISDSLTRHGIAVLRYDDRGTAKSTGTFANATSEDFATDVSAAVHFLRSAAGVDPARIGLIGHSEGALIGPMVAGKPGEAAFLVLLAGPAVRGDELLRVQGRLLLEASGVNEDVLDSFQQHQAQVFKLVLDGASDEEIEDAVRTLVATELEAVGLEEEMLTQLIDAQLAQIASPWMRFFIAYDPRPALAAVTCPVLALNGTLDLQVWHEQNLDELERVIREAGGDVTAKRCEGLNHLFQPATTGSISEYATIETTFDEGVLDDIVRWIHAKVGD